MTERKGWIGVDLDGTLATHTVDQWTDEGALPIGEPVPAMVARVERWLAQGLDVRIVTARVAKGFDPEGENWRAICKWIKEELGVYLPITAEKDPDMIELWDDRVVPVERNTGVDLMRLGLWREVLLQVKPCG